MQNSVSSFFKHMNIKLYAIHTNLKALYLFIFIYLATFNNQKIVITFRVND